MDNLLLVAVIGRCDCCCFFVLLFSYCFDREGVSRMSCLIPIEFAKLVDEFSGEFDSAYLRTSNLQYDLGVDLFLSFVSFPSSLSLSLAHHILPGIKSKKWGK